MVRPAYSSEQVEQIRAKIVDATLRVFRRDGFHGVSLRAIASELGWTASALYRYFASKDDLIVGVRVAGYELMKGMLEGSRSRGVDPLEGARNAMRDYVRFAFDEPELFRLMYDINRPEATGRDAVRTARERAFEVVRGMLADAISTGLTTGEPNALAHLAWISAHGLALLASTGQLELGLTLEQLLDPVIDQVLGRQPSTEETIS